VERVTSDILKSWKENRFIVVSDDLKFDKKLVVITDISFWSASWDELNEWCKNRNASVEGMTVVFDDEMTLTEFILRWSL
jgi:hypothetical protein